MRRSLLALALAVLMAIPMTASAHATSTLLTGHGVIGPISSGETVRFGFVAGGSETAAHGWIRIRTIVPGDLGHWSILGRVVCIAYLEDALIDSTETLHDVWEIRYRMVRSNFPAGETSVPGAHASFYVEDDQSGDWAGELTGTDDYMQSDCGPRGQPPIFSLLKGNIRVRSLT